MYSQLSPEKVWHWYPDHTPVRYASSYLSSLWVQNVATSWLVHNTPCFFCQETTVSHAGKDGRLYYDIAVRIQSYASRQQLAVSDTERQDAIVQEFDRVLLTTLGTASLRLYEFRIQTPYKKYAKATSVYKTMADSFQCKEV